MKNLSIFSKCVQQSIFFSKKKCEFCDKKTNKKHLVIDATHDLKESFIKSYEGWKKTTSNKSSVTELKTNFHSVERSNCYFVKNKK